MTEENVCVECGTPTVESREDYHYTECGLDNVMLRDVRMWRCPECGMLEVDVGDEAELLRDIAKRLVESKDVLDYKEARFLCEYAMGRLEGWKYLNQIGEA